jgi:hypothetical protein
MRLEEGMNLAHRRGIRSLGSLPREHAQFALLAAVLGQRLGRAVLRDVATLVTPDTILQLLETLAREGQGLFADVNGAAC